MKILLLIFFLVIHFLNAAFPGARTYHDTTILDDNMYLFGGEHTESTSVFYLADMWTYYTVSNEWERIFDSNCRSYINTRENLCPGSRSGHSMNSAKSSVYLFGGYRLDGNLQYLWSCGSNFSSITLGITHEYLADLWMFKPIEREWVWLYLDPSTSYAHVNRIGSYLAEPYWPGSRTHHTSTVVGDDIYVFGGEGYSTTDVGYLCDLWKFDTITETWQFIDEGCDEDYYNKNDYYGVDFAFPGSRKGSSMGHLGDSLYLFGGHGRKLTYPSPDEYLCDLWRFNMTALKWNFMEFAGCPGTHAAVFGHYNESWKFPGSRGYAELASINGNLFLYGGEGYANAYELPNVGILCDWWKFDPSTGEWTQDINGCLGSYTEHVSLYDSANALAGSRMGHSLSVGPNGQMIIFGGLGIGENASSYSEYGYLCDTFYYDSSTWEVLDHQCKVNDFAGYHCNVGFGYFDDAGSCYECAEGCKVCDDLSACVEKYCEKDFDFCKEYVDSEEMASHQQWIVNELLAAQLAFDTFLGDLTVYQGTMEETIMNIMINVTTNEYKIAALQAAFDFYVMFMMGEYNTILETFEVFNELHMNISIGIAEMSQYIEQLSVWTQAQETAIADIFTVIDDMSVAMEAKVLEIETAISGILTRLDALDGVIVDINLVLDDLKPRVTQLETDVATNTASIGTLNSQHTTMQGMIDANNLRDDAQDVKLLELYDENVARIADIEKLTNVTEELDIAHVAAIAQLEEKHDTDIAAMELKNEETKTKHNSDIALLMEEIRVLKEMHDNQTKVIEELQAEVDKLEKKHDSENDASNEVHASEWNDLNETMWEEILKLRNSVYVDSPKNSLYQAIASSGISFAVMVLVLMLLVFIFVMIIICVFNYCLKREVVREKVDQQDMEMAVVGQGMSPERKQRSRKPAGIFVVMHKGKEKGIVLNEKGFMFGEERYEYSQITAMRKGKRGMYGLEVNEELLINFVLDEKDVDDFQELFIQKLQNTHI